LSIKSALKRMIPKKYHKKLAQIRTEYIRGYAEKSYSQEGEDMVLRRIFRRQEKGFYVDVGAYHPKRFSNTYFLYRKGWRGINIDATPGVMAEFNKVRKRDVNLNVGVSLVPGELTYYMFDEPALNSFDEKLAKERSKKTANKIKKRVKIKTVTLESILDEQLGSNKMDLLSVDVEGFDLQVLQSNNWDRFRPRYVLVESLGYDLSRIRECPIYQFLKGKGYEVFAKTFYTFFYKDEKEKVEYD